jgi:hypothetical protein
MAQLDGSFYLQSQAPDIGQGIERGMRLGDMMKERRAKDLEMQKQSDIKEAYNSAYDVKEDGSKVFNPMKLGDLVRQKGYGQDAFKIEQDVRTQQAANLKSDLENQYNESSYVYSLLNGVNDQASFDAAKAQAKAKGIQGVDQIGNIYDPKFVESLKGQYGKASMTYEKQLEDSRKREAMAEQRADRSFDRQLQMGKLDLDRKKTETEAAKPKLTAGQEALDKKFADDVNDWTSDGRAQSISDVAQLRNVVKNLEGGAGTTGGLTGAFGDRVTSSDVLKNRATVKKAALPLIKRFLSGATSDSDREAVINTLWNEADSTKNNMDRIVEFANTMDSRIQNMDLKSKAFKDSGGTLANFELGAPPQPNQSKPQTIIQNGFIYKLNPQTGEYE